MVMVASVIGCRAGKSISGKPADTTFQARSVSGSRASTPPFGTATLSFSIAGGGPDGVIRPRLAIISTAVTAVSTSGARDPTVSRERASGITPSRLILPAVGLNPTTPQGEARLPIHT